MKILNPYRFYKGYGGGGNNASIPALVPPPQDSRLLKSISIAEIIDLLCEGPIYGLVDQFGRKIYGLDMLKGIYLNKIPVMNYDGKYNFRNIVMEINLGTENQKPLANFNNVYIYKPANFKLLGPITTDKDIRPIYEGTDDKGNPTGGISSQRRLGNGDFTSWATGWPTEAKDGFSYIHHIKNKDVKKLRISLIIESLFDTIDQGTKKGESGRMGMSKETSVTISIACGVEGANRIPIREYTFTGIVTSPYACTIGDPIAQPNLTPVSRTSTTSNSGKSAASIGGSLSHTNTVVLPIANPITIPNIPIVPESPELVGEQE